MCKENIRRLSYVLFASCWGYYRGAVKLLTNTACCWRCEGSCGANAAAPQLNKTICKLSSASILSHSCCKCASWEGNAVRKYLYFASLSKKRKLQYLFRERNLAVTLLKQMIAFPWKQLTLCRPNSEMMSLLLVFSSCSWNGSDFPIQNGSAQHGTWDFSFPNGTHAGTAAIWSLIQRCLLLRATWYVSWGFRIGGIFFCLSVWVNLLLLFGVYFKCRALNLLCQLESVSWIL